MRNSKAFTLVELIVIIIILGVIMAFALPNITSTLERNKKDQMIIDAKDMVDKAKNYMLSGKESYPEISSPVKLYLNDLDTRNEIVSSPFGTDYDKYHSYVNIVCKEESGVCVGYEYLVCLTDGSYDLEAEINLLSLDEKYKHISPVDLRVGSKCS